jgi:hypothetical protein
MRVRVAGIGAWGPGFSDWPELASRLRGETGEAPAPEQATLRPPAPACIPPRERRRAPASVKLAVEVADQACRAAGVAADQAACVFASGMGDMDITDYMCRTLASDDPLVSPTKFHNSVHNAPVGYWSISQGCKQPGNAVSAFGHTVPASLLEAAVQCATEALPVLWASQDLASPAPFRDIADIGAPCAFALLLLPGPEGPGTPLRFGLSDGSGAWPTLEHAALAPLYEANPSARALPLLAVLARAQGAVRLPCNASRDLVVECA